MTEHRLDNTGKAPRGWAWPRLLGGWVLIVVGLICVPGIIAGISTGEVGMAVGYAVAALLFLTPGVLLVRRGRQLRASGQQTHARTAEAVQGGPPSQPWPHGADPSWHPLPPQPLDAGGTPPVAASGPPAWGSLARQMPAPEPPMALTPEVRARLRAQRGDAHTSRRPSEHRGSAAPATRTCPYCKEEIHEDAVSCKHCGKTTLSARQWWRGCLLLVVTSACLGVGWKLGCEPDCKRREQECRAKFATARAKIEALPGYPSRLVVKPINDVVGDWPHCEDTSCDAGPCASCWWKVGDRCSPSIFATVERWGNPLEVRAGSQVYEIHFNEP